MNNKFKAVIEKFENDILDNLLYKQDFQLDTKNQSNKQIKYELYKTITIDDLTDMQREDIINLYFHDFETEAFDTWWRFNGDDYLKQFKKEHGNTDDAIIIAFDEWIQQNGADTYNEFVDSFDIVLYYTITISTNDQYDRYDFNLNYFAESPYSNEPIFKDNKYVEIYDVHLNQMSRAVNQAFGFDGDFNIKETRIEDYYTASINKIAKKLLH